MQVFSLASEMENFERKAHRQGQKISFVPTMGALHEGHRALFHEARKQGSVVVVSLFVNPKQFNDPKDFEKYPKNFEKDKTLCEQEKIDVVFAPTVEEVYPEGTSDLKIPLPDVAQPLEGKLRPGHFEGVVAVVARLFQMVQPDDALFGEKDYQQLRVIQDMTKQQGLPVRIVGHPTVRTSAGLALSSRNQRLTKDGLQKALVIFQSLQKAKKLFSLGERRPLKIQEEVKKSLLQSSDVQIDSVDVVDADSLHEIDSIQKKALVAVAVFIEGVRLIDNCLLNPTSL